MRHTIIIALLLITLFPNTALAQWGFDAVSVEAYINDHKKQRSLLLARSTLEYSNQLLHEYSSEEVGKYKELNVDLDKYTRAFDIIDVMYQSLRTVLNVKSTYQTVSDRISDYKNLLEDFNDKVIKRKHIELADTMLISINKKAIDNIYNEGSQLYHSVNDLVLYATGAAACSTSDLLMVLDNIKQFVGPDRKTSEPSLLPDMAVCAAAHGLLEGEGVSDEDEGRDTGRCLQPMESGRKT